MKKILIIGTGIIVIVIAIMAILNKDKNSAPTNELAKSDTTEVLAQLNDVDQSDYVEVESLSLSEIDSGLSEIESEGLVFMREEEKLARDVYLALDEYWNMNIFQNIARSEETHTQSIKYLLDKYDISDPVTDDQPGVFINQNLQKMYDDLVAQGRQSLSEALLVGAMIEEVDIADLDKYLAQTDNSDITLVYENLQKGSRNHLRSFVSVYEKFADEDYSAQYMDATTVSEILNSDRETGNVQGNQDGNGRRGR
jgi:hypothetical protein